MEKQTHNDARDRGPAIEIKRIGSRLTVCASTDRGFRTARRALDRIGADVENLGTYNIRAEFGIRDRAHAVERLMQYAGARGVRNILDAAPEGGMPYPPVKGSA